MDSVELPKPRLGRKVMLTAIEAYYKSIGRTNPPKFHTYNLLELQKTINLFNIVQ